jgi:putative restriction endonuclease
VFQTVSQSAARQFEATRAGALDFVDANDADEATAVIDGDNYAPRTGDQRRVTARQIRERRGQRAFRDALRRRYGGRCAVTGCTVLDLLEAAHIKPYRGDRDNNPQNGLLLRADIHTLFDLDLLGIEPE